MTDLHRYEASVEWRREGARFTDNRYSRGHRWRFDGGTEISASSSPAVVPLPMSVAASVDPEEALVAATSSCHMLWFLSLAAAKGWVVDSYDDDAFGVMEKNSQGKVAFSRIVLRPRIEFSGAAPDATALAAVHARAHDECFIANSLRATVEVESP